MKEIIINSKKSIFLPETPEELSEKQFVAIAGLLHQQYTTALKAATKALRILSGYSRIKFLFLSAEITLNCLDHVMWVFDTISITQNKIPCYKGFYGPKEELNNMTLAEFHFAEHYYSQIKENNYDALPHLIATIYRKAKPAYNKKLDSDGDVRQKFNSNTVDFYAKKISKWPDAVKYAILIFYDSCRAKIAKDNADIFGGGGTDDGLGMYSVMRGLAGPKFGELEKVEEMYLHNALLELNLINKEAEELKAKYKQ